MNTAINTTTDNFSSVTQGFALNSWMSDVPIIDSLSLAQLVLPGAHNAGVDKKASYFAPGASNWIACQNNSFYYQLNSGARALDLRLRYEMAGNGVGTFWFEHNGFRSSRSLENLITSVIRFLEENPDEFIVLDFHQLNAGNRPFDYKEFNRLLLTHLGHRIIPYTDAFLSLGQLKRLSPARRVLVAAEYHPDFDWTYFHQQIEHKWSGISTTSVSELNAYLTHVMKSPPSRALPWSLSATSYHVATGPVNIGAYIDQWFDPEIKDWATNSSIINTDFFETSNVVRHCRMANLLRAYAK
jgi:1-phosphatidylinositol phosphodiesterase